MDSYELTDRLERKCEELGQLKFQLERANDKLATANSRNEGSVVKLLDAMADGRKIDAIKEYRWLTGYGLKESKDAVERVTNQFTNFGAPR